MPNQWQTQDQPGSSGAGERVYTYGMGKGSRANAAPQAGANASASNRFVPSSGASASSVSNSASGTSTSRSKNNNAAAYAVSHNGNANAAFANIANGNTPNGSPKNSKNNRPNQSEKNRKPASFWIAIIVALLCIALAAFLVFTMLGNSSSGRDGELGQLDGKTQEEIQAEIDRVVEEGMFNISIASMAEFENGTSPGELRIENVPNNPYLMKVLINRTDTDEQIYQTGIIEPNHHIQSDTLDVNLPAGTYDCIATFLALDPETEEEVGRAAASITLVVKN